MHYRREYLSEAKKPGNEDQRDNGGHRDESLTREKTEERKKLDVIIVPREAQTNVRRGYPPRKRTFLMRTAHFRVYSAMDFRFGPSVYKGNNEEGKIA